MGCVPSPLPLPERCHTPFIHAPSRRPHFPRSSESPFHALAPSSVHMLAHLPSAYAPVRLPSSVLHTFPHNNDSIFPACAPSVFSGTWYLLHASDGAGSRWISWLLGNFGRGRIQLEVVDPVEAPRALPRRRACNEATRTRSLVGCKYYWFVLVQCSTAFRDGAA